MPSAETMDCALRPTGLHNVEKAQVLVVGRRLSPSLDARDEGVSSVALTR